MIYVFIFLFVFQAEKFLQMSKENEQCLVEELSIARDAQLAAERQKQDLGLLREHRASLEQQLAVSDDRYKDLRTQMNGLSAKANDLSAQVLNLSQQLAREKQKEIKTITPAEPRQTQLDCEQCEVCSFCYVLLVIRLHFKLLAM
jgi:chromosome segregation ATPase